MLTCTFLTYFAQQKNSSEQTSPKSSVITAPEPAWEIEYYDSVPDLYPELSDSLEMQEGDTEQLVRREGLHYFIFPSHSFVEDSLATTMYKLE